MQLLSVKYPELQGRYDTKIIRVMTRQKMIFLVMMTDITPGIG